MSTYLLRMLFVHTAGTRLVLDGDAVKALRDDARPRRLPLTAIDSIVVFGGVDVSTPLLVRCGEDGRTVVFLSRNGRPRAVVEGSLERRGLLRREQYWAHFDDVRRAQLAGSIVRGKIEQMQWGVRQWRRDASEAHSLRLSDIDQALTQDLEDIEAADRSSLLGIEGAATRRYFGALALALKVTEFSGRNRRPPRDPINALLSFLYGLSGVALRGAVHAAGLDPMCGFLHGDRDAQPSLVLDLAEEFRPHADRLAVKLLNQRKLLEKHFASDLAGAISLTDDGREIVFDAWHRHRTSNISVRGLQQEISHAALPIVQANRFANALRSGDCYEPHRARVR